MFPVYSGFGLHKIPVYSGFSWDMFPVYAGFGLHRIWCSINSFLYYKTITC
jgi:hypothetical protein